MTFAGFGIYLFINSSNWAIAYVIILWQEEAMPNGELAHICANSLFGMRVTGIAAT